MPRLAITVRRTSRKRIEEMMLEKTTNLDHGRMPEMITRTEPTNHDDMAPRGRARRGLVCFSGLEAALLAADPVRLRHDAKQHKGARRMARLLERPQRLLVTVLLITAVADILAILLATRQLVASFGLTGYVIAVAARFRFTSSSSSAR
jgi:hypothetical protein